MPKNWPAMGSRVVIKGGSYINIGRIGKITGWSFSKSTCRIEFDDGSSNWFETEYLHTPEFKDFIVGAIRG